MNKVQRTCGGLNPNSYEAFDYAEREYKHIRSMSRDCIYVSRNTGIPFEVASLIKGYIFENQHFLSKVGLYGRFDSDFAMAQSWVRLSNRTSNKHIQPHDILLLQHEWLEIQFILNHKLSQEEAHEEASKVYDYQAASISYYRRLGFNIR